MNEWTVVSVLIALVGLFITIGKPIINLNNTMTTLNITVQQNNKELEDQKKELKEQRDSAHTSHQRLWDKNDEQDKAISDHETRIRVLEHKEV